MTVKISEILHVAADQYLWSGSDYFLKSNEDHDKTIKYACSCNAIYVAIVQNNSISWKNKQKFFFRVKKGLTAMGLQKSGVPKYWNSSSNNFDDKRVQQERYSWLKFAALVAEEQGQ